MDTQYVRHRRKPTKMANHERNSPNYDTSFLTPCKNFDVIPKGFYSTIAFVVSKEIFIQQL
ncbi:unnamed protein product [Clavelina lepadiformis]|uniref:Uncharacterized protein n=1 Tax=Clavelina lepadiformis TaxID=159417 RepID=A0ABP0F4Z8_CLALP